MQEDRVRAKEKAKANVTGKYIGRRKITFDRGPLTIIGEAYQDENFITVITSKGNVRIAIESIIFDDYAGDR